MKGNRSQFRHSAFSVFDRNYSQQQSASYTNRQALAQSPYYSQIREYPWLPMTSNQSLILPQVSGHSAGTGVSHLHPRGSVICHHIDYSVGCDSLLSERRIDGDALYPRRSVIKQSFPPQTTTSNEQLRVLEHQKDVIVTQEVDHQPRYFPVEPTAAENSQAAPALDQFTYDSEGKTGSRVSVILWNPKQLLSEESFSKMLQTGEKTKESVQIKGERSVYEKNGELSTANTAAAVEMMSDQFQLQKTQAGSLIPHGHFEGPKSKSKHMCDECGRAFTRFSTLITHKRIHTGDKPYECKQCGRPFRQLGNLSRHQLTHTTFKPYSCQQCNKSFNRASNLHTHMRTHSDYKPFSCDFCGKRFHQKVDMKIHRYTHTGEKPHKCQKCGRGFKQLTHLTYHMRTHSDVCMYKCEFCGKGFNQKGNLKAHVYRHTGERPFKCDVCGKGFTLASTLNTHKSTHAPHKPFHCQFCDKAFYQKNALKSHCFASHPFTGGISLL